MPKNQKYHNDFVIDRLTNSILNCISSESFPTEVILLSKNDLKQTQKKNGWKFNWKHELNQPDREVYKLVTTVNPDIVHGIVSLTVKDDHVFIHVIENAPFNQGSKKLYDGVAGNLVAFGCRLSFQRGNQGVVSFYAKTKLVNHYEKTLGAKLIGMQLMIIYSEEAKILVDKYFK
jgi:hypothetical protein